MKSIILLFATWAIATISAEKTDSPTTVKIDSQKPPTTNSISSVELGLNTTNLLAQRSLAPRNKVDFSSGQYQWISDAKAFFKFHELKKPYDEAVKVCSNEDAELFYPRSLSESQAVIGNINIRDATQIWLGIKDARSYKNYVTATGHPIPYSNWPADGCVVLRFSNADFDTFNCGASQYYVCRRLSAPDMNAFCGTKDAAYTYRSELKSCYKVHTAKKTWRQALAVCKSEKATLAILNSNEEANYVIGLFAKYPPGLFMVGFNDLINQGQYLNMDGNTLEESGYAKWDKGQPNNAGGKEHCGQIRTGGLNDIACDGELFNFICEKAII